MRNIGGANLFCWEVHLVAVTNGHVSYGSCKANLQFLAWYRALSFPQLVVNWLQVNQVSRFGGYHLFCGKRWDTI